MSKKKFCLSFFIIYDLLMIFDDVLKEMYRFSKIIVIKSLIDVAESVVKKSSCLLLKILSLKLEYFP